MTPEQLAEFFHITYERLAPAFGWRTKKGCNVPFAQLPQRNKALMVATCQTVLNALQECGAVANGPTTLAGVPLPQCHYDHEAVAAAHQEWSYCPMCAYVFR